MDRNHNDPAISYSSQHNVARLIRLLTTSDDSRPITVFSGAGGSPAGSWNEFVTALNDHIVADPTTATIVISSTPDLLRRAGYSLSYGGSNREYEHIRDVLYANVNLQSPGPLAQAVAQFKAELPLRVRLVTTNFDDQLEGALEGFRATPLAYGLNEVDQWHESNLDDEALAVLHLHGMVTRDNRYKNPIVLSEENFLEYGDTVRATVREIISASHVVFVGTSMSDPNILEPLYKTRDEREKAGLLAFALFSADLGNRISPQEAADEWDERQHSFRLQQRDYLDRVLGVRSILLKSHWQVAQLMYELTLASDQPDRYEDNDEQSSLRYGHRFRRALDHSYLALGVPASRSHPEDREISNISERLAEILDREEGPIGHLRSVQQQLAGWDLSSAYGLPDGYLEAEGFGLFLWLRCRSIEPTVPPYQLRLLGTSTFAHWKYWSFESLLPIRAGLSLSGDAAYTGQSRLSNLQDERTFSLWNSGFAVPIMWVNEMNQRDVTCLGVITLQSTRTLVDRGTLRSANQDSLNVPKLYSPSTLSFVDDWVELERLMSDAAIELLRVPK